ncbi:Clp protease ClpP [Alistipes timonensis]
MSIDNLQYVVGEVKSGEVATIRFFGRITSESTARFNEEFDYLENTVRPSCIRVLINSEGGSVLYGMSTYATIQNSTIDTECVIEGMAASMASILWAAGRRSLMRDYGILMIHNPMLPGDETEQPSDMVRAFTRQIETIYRKRFGLKVEHVRAIMQGEAGKDGTYFDAMAAVKAGIIPSEHVLHTSKQLVERVHNDMTGITDATAIQELMSRVAAENKHFIPAAPTLIQTNQPRMSEEKTISVEYGAVVASLGMEDSTGVKDVMARITELMGVEARLRQVQQSLTDAQTVLAGKEAAIQNLQKDLTGVTDRLQKYEKQEADQKAAAIESFLQKAADEGKIEPVTIPSWVEMAQTNFTLVQSTIDSIPAREKISQQIAADPANVQAATAAIRGAEERMAEEVESVVGKDFAFGKLK